MSDPLRHVVDETEVGTRFDRLVATVAGLSRAEAAAQVDGGRALLDDRRVQRSTRVFQGQIVAVLTNDDDVDLPAARVPYSLVYEDEALLVIDKTAGVVVHPGAAHPSDSLVNGLVGDFPNLLVKISIEEASDFLNDLHAVASEKQWQSWKDNYGTLRNDAEFWPLFDQFTDWNFKNQSPAAGHFDLRYYSLLNSNY